VTASDEKFQNLDLPLILAALHRAREAKKYSEVVVKISKDGGCVEISTTSKENLK